MKKLHLFSSLTMAFALTLSTGCPADEDPVDDGSNDSSGGADDGGTMNPPTTNGGSGMMEGSTGGDDTAGPMTMGMTTMMPTTMGGTTSGPDPLPDGSQCTADADCESMNCFVAGALGGICGECNEDADCEFGCSLPNPLTSAPSVCNMGELGGGCESTDVCEDGLVCALILDVPMILSASTCSECEDDAGCTEADTSCQPIYDVANISGQKECVANGSIENGNGCDLVTGNTACMSGFCGEADFMSFLSLGVCGECLANSDCDEGAGEECLPPEIDLAKGLVPATCAVPE